MSPRHACALTLSFLILPAFAQTAAQTAAPPAPDAAPAVMAVTVAGAPPDAAEVPATVVVEGRRPGPGVWKVSKGEHVMWVFGLYSPLPQKMEWDASRVERLVGKSQEVLMPPGVSVGVGFFRSLTLLPALVGLEKNPDGARLQDVLPADVYARWQVQKGKYIGDDDGVERVRPFFAAEKLLHAGLKKNGLVYDIDVREQIDKIARRDKVKVTGTMLEIELDDPRRTLKAFKQMQMADLTCFTKTLERLDGDIDAMRVRANAWANGNIAEIAGLDYTERDEACGNALWNSPLASTTPDLQNVPERIRANWLKAAGTALAQNASTFALLQMKHVVGPKSYLAALQAQGYTVESPTRTIP